MALSPQEVDFFGHQSNKNIFSMASKIIKNKSVIICSCLEIDYLDWNTFKLNLERCLPKCRSKPKIYKVIFLSQLFISVYFNLKLWQRILMIINCWKFRWLKIIFSKKLNPVSVFDQHYGRLPKTWKWIFHQSLLRMIKFVVDMFRNTIGLAPEKF